MAKGRSNPTSEPSGKAFGRYRVLSPLGQGAMASVFLAEDPALGRLVAIKVIHSHLASQKDLLTRFTSEAKTAAALRSPNIVEVFDYGLEGESQYLVMEYIDGPTLQHVLNQKMGQPLDSLLAASLIVQAAEGLMIAERKAVVHRDIKPENLMLTSNGLLKIADFGIAHINEQNLTQTGSVLGSPSYMAPEQVEGSKPSHQTDMFALGSVFYACLTGRKPFSGPNIPAIFRAICELPHRPVLEAQPDADPQLAAWANVLLSKDPKDRGEGAKALAGQLRQWLNQKGVFDPADYVQNHLGKGSEQLDGTMVEHSSKPPVISKPGISSLEEDESQVEKDEGLKPSSPQGATSKPKSADLPKSKTVDLPKPHPKPEAKATPAPVATFGHSKWVMVGMGAVIALLIGVLIALMSNRNSGNPAKPPSPAIPEVQTGKPLGPPVPALSLLPDTLEMNVGSRREMQVLGLPDSFPISKLIWVSHDSAVAKWDSGWIHAIHSGVSQMEVQAEFSGTTVRAFAHVSVTGAKSPSPNPIQATISTPVAGQIPAQPPVSGKDSASTGSVGGEESGKTQLTVLSAPPFAEVFVDGLFIGATPTKNKSIKSGSHRILISHRRFQSIDTQMVFKSGPVKVKFHFTQPKP